MKLGKAYKLASLAAGHKVKALACLNAGDHEGARREEVHYIDRVEDIPSHFRQRLSSYLDDVVALKLRAVGSDQVDQKR